MTADRVRLNRWLAMHGQGSRRACDELIREGRVEVNGETVRELGLTIDPRRDHVRVDGVRIGVRPRRAIYLAMHKPKGVITTRRDPQGRPTVMQLLPVDLRDLVFPVGRLDLNSEGLLFFTNDGELANRIAHPSHRLRKVYLAKLRGRVSDNDLRRWLRGISYQGRVLRADKVRRLESRSKHTWLRITLSSGLYRQIRFMARAIEHPVIKLKRVAIGPVKLGDLEPGAVRVLSPEEVSELERWIDRPEPEPKPRPSRRRRKPATRRRRPAPPPRPRRAPGAAAASRGGRRRSRGGRSPVRARHRGRR